MRLLIVLLLLVASHSAGAFCFQDAGQRYHLDPILLEAIAIQESSLRPAAVNLNRDAHGQVTSTDYGVMQINSKNADQLIRLGLIAKPEDLLRDACFNVQVGAWILAKHLRVCGNTWRCLGSYNAGFHPSARQEERRVSYSRSIRDLYGRLKARPSRTTQPAPLAVR